MASFFGGIVLSLVATISIQHVQGFKRPHVLSIGEALYDLIAGPQCNGWTVDQVLTNSQFQPFPGGAPANVATAFSKLGGQASFAGALGLDTAGNNLISLLQEIGVNTQHVQQLAAYPTRQVLVTRTASGDREFAGFIDKLPSNDFADCYYHHISAGLELNNKNNVYDAVVMGTLGLIHGPTANSMQSLVKHWSTSNTNQYPLPLLVVDVNWRKAFWERDDESVARKKILEFVQSADLIKLTDMEAKWLFDMDPTQALHDPERVYDKLGVSKGVLVTGGELGASFYLKGIGSSYQSAYTVDVVETTGAGDAFTAGFLKSLLSNHENNSNSGSDASVSISTPPLWTLVQAQKALDMASAAGALTCSNPGAIAGQPTLEQVLSLMKKGPLAV